MHTTINTMPDFGMKDPGRYERAMALFFVMIVILGIVVPLADRLLRKPAVPPMTVP